MNQYLCLTIGPIHATLQQARKTRELWAASYLFSRLMELLSGTLQKQLKADILLPNVENNTGRIRYGAGLYNDRLFARVDACNPEAIEKAIDDAVGQLAAEIAPKGKPADTAFWRHYFRIEWLCKPLESLQSGALFSQTTPVLDAAELHDPYFCDLPDHNPMVEFLDGVYTTQVAKDALRDDNKGVYKDLIKGLFPSTADLGIYELLKRDKAGCEQLMASAMVSEDQDMKEIDAFYDLLFNADKDAHPFVANRREYHKYFCIIHADADNLGSLNTTLNDAAAYRNLSGKLSRFALDAARMINEFGGKPVFIGGDDLLFLAPVCSFIEGRTQSVFQLIEQLSSEYERIGLGPQTHLSFGMTVSYYKFPLFEAHALSYEQLMYRAKKAIWADGSEKNAVAFRLLKHSGAYFEGVLSKPALKAFTEAEAQLRQTAADLLSGIVYKMDTLSNLMMQVHTTDDQWEARLDFTFDNFFNEAIHKKNAEHMALVRSLVKSIYAAGSPFKDQPEEQDANLYAALRLLKFITDTGNKAVTQLSTNTAG